MKSAIKKMSSAKLEGFATCVLAGKIGQTGGQKSACPQGGVRYGEGEHENPIVKWESKKGMNQQK